MNALPTFTYPRDEQPLILGRADNPAQRASNMATRGSISRRGDDDDETVLLHFPAQKREADTPAKRFVVKEQARAEAANADAKPNAVPPIRERRSGAVQDPVALRAGLTAEQLDALSTLEQFRWTLRFVRRPLFRAPIPIVFSPDGSRFIVIEDDGSVNENPGFKIRP